MLDESVKRLRDRDPDVHVDVNDADVITHLRGNLGQVAADADHSGAALDLVAEHVAAFGKPELSELVVVHDGSDRRGGRSIVLQQFAGGIPIEGGSLRVHIRADGRNDTVSNNFAREIRPSKAKAISSDDAMPSAAKAVDGDPGDVTDATQVIDVDGRLVWRVRLRGARIDGPPRRWVVDIDGATGVLLDLTDERQTSFPSTARGVGYYSEDGPISVLTDQTGSFLYNRVHEVAISFHISGPDGLDLRCRRELGPGSNTAASTSRTRSRRISIRQQGSQLFRRAARVPKLRWCRQ